MSTSTDEFLATNEEFPTGYPSDVSFTSSNLSQGKLVVSDVLPGGITIIDNDGNVVLPDQSEYIDTGTLECTGVIVDLSAFDVQGVWKVRYNRGIRGQQGKQGEAGIVSQEDIMKYILLLG